MARVVVVVVRRRVRRVNKVTGGLYCGDYFVSYWRIGMIKVSK